MARQGSEMLTTGAVAHLLGASRQHIVDMCDRGELASVRVGSHRRIPRSEVARVLRSTLTRDQERSLWLHRGVAGHLVVHPRHTMEKAKANVTKLAVVHVDTRAGEYVQRWAELLAAGVDAVLETLTSSSPEAVELRQNSPFAGVLSDEDRRACLTAFNEHWRGEHAA